MYVIAIQTAEEAGQKTCKITEKQYALTYLIKHVAYL